jgi:hypothetical protein
MGATLGHLAGRIDALKKQRTVVAGELKGVIATAQRMLSELGGEAAAGARRVQAAVPKAGRKRKRRLSAQGRANIIAAAKKRWAKYNAEKRKGA